MKRLLVRYKLIDAARAEANEALVRAVFEELHQDRPAGLRYATFKLDDGLSFVHIASIETDDGSNPLGETAAFKAFQAEIGDRCEIPPEAVELHEVGSYGLFGG